MKIVSIILLAFLFLHCQDQIPTQNQEPVEIVNDNNKITIIDKTGKEWDITDAVHKFGFEPSKFHHGLGPNTIRPITSPRFLLPDNPTFPSPSETFVVLATTLKGESRAYPLSILKDHEIVDDSFGNTHVAVAY